MILQVKPKIHYNNKFEMKWFGEMVHQKSLDKAFGNSIAVKAFDFVSMLNWIEYLYTA